MGGGGSVSKRGEAGYYHHEGIGREGAFVNKRGALAEGGEAISHFSTTTTWRKRPKANSRRKLLERNSGGRWRRTWSIRLSSPHLLSSGGWRWSIEFPFYGGGGYGSLGISYPLPFLDFFWRELESRYFFLTMDFLPSPSHCTFKCLLLPHPLWPS